MHVMVGRRILSETDRGQAAGLSAYSGAMVEIHVPDLPAMGFLVSPKSS